MSLAPVQRRCRGAQAAGAREITGLVMGRRVGADARVPTLLGAGPSLGAVGGPEERLYACDGGPPRARDLRAARRAGVEASQRAAIGDAGTEARRAYHWYRLDGMFQPTIAQDRLHKRAPCHGRWGKNGNSRWGKENQRLIALSFKEFLE